jgi:Flp pilus assembly protein TadD
VREFQLAAKLAPTDANPHWRLARLYQSMGKKDEAAIEFQTTSSLHKAEEESIAAKLKARQDRGKPSAYTGTLPANP